jgi:hypothetical protein
VVNGLSRFAHASNAEYRRAVESLRNYFGARYQSVKRRSTTPPDQRKPWLTCSCGRSGMCATPFELPQHVREALESGSRGLDRINRRRFERSFRTDLSAVQICLSLAADESTRALGASAYALNNSIVFSSGLFEPESPQGDWLLAHELVHIAQQQLGKLRPSDLNKAGSFLCERQANLIADQLVLRKRAQNLSLNKSQLFPVPSVIQTVNPIIAKCGSICVEVFLDPANGAPCGLVDCGFTSTPGPRATSWCAYSCAANKYGAFIINTVCGPVGPYFTDQFAN